ncbi:MAG: malonyl-ACP O-methyltransferase BioC [Betaproteobacteria bacterium]|nr:malonyl-ACP O-methyltransferase BioC [Betaproteobacteria bacterium]
MSDALHLDKRLVRRAFDAAAPGYDQVAVLQREVATRLLERLDYLAHAPRLILDAGAGTGFGTRALAARYGEAAVVALDLAPRMLEVARAAQSWWRRMPRLWPSRQAFVCADIERLPLKTAVGDMVWSSLALQWCNSLEHAFSEFRRVLSPSGLLVFSTFGPDTLRELREAFADIDGYTHVNRFMDMHDIGDLLVRTGFATPVVEMETITLTYPDLKACLHDLKAMGAHNVTQGRPQGFMGKGPWRALEAGYERFRRDGRLPATFEVVYGHAWAGGESTRRAGDSVAIRMPVSRRPRAAKDVSA